MEHREIGRTGVKVSAIALGCWVAGVDWWGHYSDEQALRLFAAAFDHGITFFDNGDAYGNGRAETLLGRFAKTTGRERIQIGGKFGYDFYSDPGEAGSHRERRQDFSTRFLRFALEQSLRRLGTDYLDLYMAHNIKLPQFSDELFAELEKLRDEGKVRAWGVSLGPAIGWREEGIEALGRHRAQAVQTVFNLFEQDPGREFCQMAQANHAAILARVHDHSGVLKEKVAADSVIAPDDHRKFRDAAWKIYGVRKLEKIRPFAAAHGMSIHQLACKWLLQQPALASITATLLDEAEIKEAAEAVSKPSLSTRDIAALADLYADDFGLGNEAHPCDLKSSVDPAGRVRSGYVPPPVLLAGQPEPIA